MRLVLIQKLPPALPSGCNVDLSSRGKRQDIRHGDERAHRFRQREQLAFQPFVLPPDRRRRGLVFIARSEGARSACFGVAVADWPFAVALRAHIDPISDRPSHGVLQSVLVKRK